MNSKQTKLKKSILSPPTPKNITYKEIHSLLLNLGCKLDEGAGSRLTYSKDKNLLQFHKPHPENTLKSYVILKIREFLLQLGEKP